MKQTIQKTSFSKESFSSIMKNIPDLMWVKDKNGVYLACNKRFEEFFGTTESEIVGKTDYDFVDKEQADFFTKHDKEVLKTGKPVVNYEELTFASDGHKEYIHVTKTILHDEKNQFLGILGIGRDFTKEKEIKKHLEKTLNRLELAINSTKDGLWDWDPVKNKVFFSNNWKTMLGYTIEEIGDNVEEWSSRVHPDDLEETMGKLKNHLARKTDIYESTHRLKCKDGSWKWILDRGQAQFDKNGEVLRVVGYHTDLTKQKNNEERLKEISEELEKDKTKYKTIMENSSDAIFIVNEQGFIIEYSKQFKELLGYSDQELLKLHVTDFEAIHSEEQIKENIFKNFSYEPVAFESKYRKKNGSFVDVHLNIVKINIDGVDYIYASCRDISNIKRYEHELIDKQHRLELAKNSASLGIWEVDLKSSDFIVDDKALEIFEISKDEFDGKNSTWEKMVDPEDFPDVENSMHESILYNKPFDVKCRINLKDNTFKYVKATGTIIHDIKNRPIKMLGTVIDITEEKIKNDRIKEQKEEFEAIFTNSKDGIAIVDLDSRFVDCNEAYLEMLGYTKEELMTKTCIDLTLPEERERSIEALKFALKHGYLQNFEKTCTSKSGRNVKINMSASLLPDKKHFIIVTKDMTLSKLLDEQSKLATMGEMIGNIAHQWRQPLSVISASASGLSLRLDYQDTIDKEYLRETSNMILDQITYLSQTIDDFRNFIKGEESYRNISLKDTITKTFNLVTPSLKNNQIALKTKINDDLIIKGNPNEIQQALINIINNAKDALKENVKNTQERFIFVSTSKLDEKTLELKITDSGGGIEENALNRIFEPYFTTKDENTGTGIGLSMVDKIIRERHSGVIDVANEEYEYEGKKYRGATFKMVFQASEA